MKRRRQRKSLTRPLTSGASDQCGGDKHGYYHMVYHERPVRLAASVIMENNAQQNIILNVVVGFDAVSQAEVFGWPLGRDAGGVSTNS